MSVRDYLKACAFDFLLCVVLGVCLGYINGGAFRLTPEIQGNFAALIGASVVLQAALFTCAFGRRTIIPGIVGMVVLLVAGILAFHVASPGSAGFFDDVEGNATLYFIVIYFSNLVVFILTRRRMLTFVFYAVAAIDVGFIQFMYKQDYVAWVCVVVVASVALLAYRNYHSNVRSTSTTQISFVGAFATGAVFGAVLLGLACAVFFGVVAPMNPGAMEFKPFTRYLNYEPIEMTGTAGTSQVNNPDNKNDDLNEEQDDTQDDNQNEDLDSGNDQDLLSGAMKAIYNVAENAQQLLQDTYNFMIKNPWSIPFVVLLVLALLSSPYWAKTWLRRRRLARMRALPPSEQACAFFAFFMKRLAILKVRKLDEQTLAEFSEGVRGKMQPYATTPKNTLHSEFGEVVDTYSRVAYGKIEPSADELGRVYSFYDGFFQAFRKEGGKVKYILFFRFFRI